MVAGGVGGAAGAAPGRGVTATPPTRAFTVVDADNSPSQVVVTITSSNTALLPLSGITLTPGTGSSSSTVGATASYLLSFAPTANQLGTSTVTITATDPTGGTSSKTFTFTVQNVPAPVITGLLILVVEATVASVGVDGAVVSTVKANAEDVSETFPALSVATTVIE